MNYLFVSVPLDMLLLLFSQYCHAQTDRGRVFTSPHYLMVVLTKPLAESEQRRRQLAHIHNQTEPRTD
ncbi:hypothetical protein OUZ56_010454 [Daphnia magna]|uniref:Secreted protein n=1 Tax=Daphnia magna TaxID=35525 RepID=A0ABR0AIN1_9CRUS|nr:hypothetical protein OUZ56_010454 [Daphnia magna]